MDVVLVAGRYTLLDQSALADLLPACVERGVGVFIGGVMNSGVLADPRPGSPLRLRPGAARVVERARRIGEVVRPPWRPAARGRDAVPARPSGRHVPGGRASARSAHLDEYPALLAHPIPADLWDELRAEGLIARGCAGPGDA